MSTALEQIVEGVLQDLETRKVSLKEIQAKALQAPRIRDAFAALNQSGTQLIAEVKRTSPSKGALAQIPDPSSLARVYQEAGAAVISVLTEARRFGGSISDLLSVRESVEIPVLRKDFIVTEYQVFETRAIGADLILLIVASLSRTQLRDFYEIATDLGMNVLIEVHDEIELERALEINPKIVGVNSRNLKTLEIHQSAFDQLLPLIPKKVIAVAESGISTRTEVARAEISGAKAILVGETLVKSADVRATINHLLER